MSHTFSPESIAVIGASSNPDSIAGRSIRYLQQHGYKGRIYPINPNHDEIAGLTSYPDVESLPTVPDLAMVILPARLVVDIVENCTDIGIDTVLIVSSGFSETGEESNIEAENRLSELADITDTEIIGPNSQGLINFAEGVTASFTPALERDELLTGEVSFVTQSGAFGGALTTILQDAGIGLNKWVATGNEADLESIDFAMLFAEDDTTKLVASYLEGFKDGRKLIELKRIDEGIDLPIVVLKGGRSDRGKEAAASHTGKIAGRQAIYDAIFSETGVIDVNDIDLFSKVIETITRLDTYPGSQIGVITTSGGAGIHIADIVDEEPNLELPELSEKVRSQLNEYIPDYGATFNPVDITAQVVNSPESFKQCIRLLANAEEIQTLVLQITNASGESAVAYAEDISDFAAEIDVPIFVVWTGGVEKNTALDIYNDSGIPVFENPARCIRTIGSTVQFADSRKPLQDAKNLPARTPNFDDTEAPESLSETDAKTLLGKYDIRTPKERLVDSQAAAVEAAEEIGYPVVAKLISTDVQHRNRIGGIKLDLSSPTEVEEAYGDIVSIANREDIDLEGISIQQQIKEGMELATGIVTDTDFGPVVMLGRGGVNIETIEDVTFRTIPLSEKQANRMLEELETVDTGDISNAAKKEIVEVLVSLSEIYCDEPWIKEADINPLIISESGAIAVDGLFVGPDR